MKLHTDTLKNIVKSSLEHSGIAARETILLTCSGGLDSVVLFHLLKECGQTFAVAHVNYKLRDKESDDDEQFVTALCASHQVTLYSRSFDTLSLSQTSGESIQMLARRLRYEWFDELIKEHRFKALLTAHHADDNIETVLLNMIRGCGFAGLTGMAVKNGKIIRPLLPVHRNELLEYALNNKLTWREDSSNAKTDYLRNQIRWQLIPEFEKVAPAFKKVFAQNIQRWYNEYELSEVLIRKYVQKRITQKQQTQVVSINGLIHSASPTAVLHYWLYPYGFHEDTLSDILLSIQSTHESKSFYSDTHRVIKTHRELILTSIGLPGASIHLIPYGSKTVEYEPYKMHFEIIDNHEDINFKNTHYHYLNADKLEFPLLLRPYQKGDYFYPFGLNKKKKLSDYFQEKKLNLLEKEQVLVVTMNDKIICLCGFQIDHRFRVTPQTKKVLRIHIQTHIK